VDPGKAVQVDPMKPTLKAHGTKRLKLKFDILFSNFAFKFNLRRYIQYVDERSRFTALVGWLLQKVEEVGQAGLDNPGPALNAYTEAGAYTRSR
jgi:hypothetical protein